jgi:hypothetical protein
MLLFLCTMHYRMMNAVMVIFLDFLQFARPFQTHRGFCGTYLSLQTEAGQNPRRSLAELINFNLFGNDIGSPRFLHVKVLYQFEVYLRCPAHCHFYLQNPLAIMDGKINDRNRNRIACVGRIILSHLHRLLMLLL